MVFIIFNFQNVFGMIKVPWSVKYARKCIGYDFPCEMEFSPLFSEIPPRLWWNSETCGEKNPSYMENHTKCISCTGISVQNICDVLTDWLTHAWHNCRNFNWHIAITFMKSDLSKWPYMMVSTEMSLSQPSYPLLTAFTIYI